MQSKICSSRLQNSESGELSISWPLTGALRKCTSLDAPKNHPLLNFGTRLAVAFYRPLGGMGKHSLSFFFFLIKKNLKKKKENHLLYQSWGGSAVICWRRIGYQRFCDIRNTSHRINLYQPGQIRVPQKRSGQAYNCLYYFRTHSTWESVNQDLLLLYIII
jgi:hypothetical protein